jgi:hypothetical protein
MSKVDFDFNLNRGYLMPTRKEKTAETDTDFSGSLDVNGTKFQISAWMRVSAQGQEYLRLAIRPENAVPKKSKTKKTETASTDEPAPFDDPMPF